MLRVKRKSLSSWNVLPFVLRLYKLIINSSRLINEFQSHNCRIDPEWVERQLQSGRGVGDHLNNLFGPELVFERSFDVRMNQELNAGRKAVTRGSEGPEVRRASSERQPVDAVGAGVDAVPAPDGHDPRQNQVVGLHKSAVELDA